MPGTRYVPFRECRTLATVTARQEVKPATCFLRDEKTGVEKTTLPKINEQESRYMHSARSIQARWQVCQSLADKKHLDSKVLAQVFRLGNSQYWQ